MAHPDAVHAAAPASARSPPRRRSRCGPSQVGGRTVAYAGVVANITGNPAMSVPLSWNGDGLPIGVHFLGRFGDEATLFRLAAQLEVSFPRFPGHLI